MTLSVKREHKGRGSERSKISLDYFKILAGTGNTIEKIDDRDSRIQYGAQFKDWSDPELYGGTENTLILTTATLVQLQKLRQLFPLQGRAFVFMA